MLILLSGCAPRNVGVCVKCVDGQVASGETDARDGAIIAKFNSELRSMEDEIKKLQADLNRERERLDQREQASSYTFKKILESLSEIGTCPSR